MCLLLSYIYPKPSSWFERVLKMYTLENKVTLITGGANGIGEEIVKEFLTERVKFVGMIDVDISKGSKLESELRSKYGKEKISFFNCDITNDDQLFDVFQKVVEKYGAIDVVVNNAGIAGEEKKMYKKEIEINFTALVTSTLKALEIMRTDEGGKGGTIINISSIGALGLRAPNAFIYSATKSAVLHFSTCIGMEEYFQHTNVRVLTLCFGVTDTKILELKGIDQLSTDNINSCVEYVQAKHLLQTPNAAAQGLVQSFKTGKTGSTWLVDNNNTSDITDDIRDAYKIMSKKVIT